MFPITKDELIEWLPNYKPSTEERCFTCPIAQCLLNKTKHTYIVSSCSYRVAGTNTYVSLPLWAKEFVYEADNLKTNKKETVENLLALLKN